MARRGRFRGAHAPRVLALASRQSELPTLFFRETLKSAKNAKSSSRRDAATSTRDACADSKIDEKMRRVRQSDKQASTSFIFIPRGASLGDACYSPRILRLRRSNGRGMVLLAKVAQDSFHYPQIRSRAGRPKRFLLFVILSLRRISRHANRRYAAIHSSRS